MTPENTYRVLRLLEIQRWSFHDLDHDSQPLVWNGKGRQAVNDAIALLKQDLMPEGWEAIAERA